MLLPYVVPEFLAGENGGGAYGIKVDEDEFPDGEAEFVETVVLKLFSLFHHYFVGDMLDLVITEVEQVLLVDVSLAILPN